MTRLVLFGGGHAHAIVLRRLAAAPLPGVDIALVTPYPKAVYTGMAPGVVAGHYRLEEAQIDIARLAERAGARLVLDAAIALRPAARSVTLERSGALEYDLLSLDVGASADTRVPGSAAYAVPVKPFEASLAKLVNVSKRRVAVVGAGAGGVEMAMALRYRGWEVTLYSDRPMFSGELAKRVESALRSRGVSLKNAPVERVEDGPTVIAEGVPESFDFVLWTAGAAPHPWLRESGLACDERGFVLVGRSLRSVSHPEVFAAGDCATLREAPHPKSGVFAVRHGAVLAENLERSIGGENLLEYEPQRRSLVLLSCGGRYAIAARGGWSAEGAWAWRWKDWIDRRWVGSFG